MTDDAAEADFRAAVARDESLGRLGRALSLSDRSSFHLLEVMTPRTLRAAVPRLVEAVGARGLAQVRTTLEQMSSREALTAAVFAALGAAETASAPLLIDASAALPSEADAWTWCLDRWNERRDRIAAERTAPVVLAAPSWLVGLLAESAPDLWSVRGPSARVDVAPPPAIAMIDRVLAEFSVAIANWPRSRPSPEDVREAASRLELGLPEHATEVRAATLLVLQEAEELHRAWDISSALHLRRLSVRCLERLLATSPDDEELRFLSTMALISLGGLERERDALDEALACYSRASGLLEGIQFSSAGLASSLGMGVAAGLYAGHTLLLLGDVGRARLLLSSGNEFLERALPRLSVGAMLAISHLALVMRASVLSKRYSEAIDASQRLEQILTSNLAPLGQSVGRVALAEFHLDRGDDDRVRDLARDARAMRMGGRLAIGIALCALGAGDQQTSAGLLRRALEDPEPLAGFSATQSPGASGETFVLGAEIARALGDDALIQQYDARARGALDHLQRLDPTSPRCVRLHARFAEERVAPSPR